MKNGSIYSADDKVSLEIYPHELRICGYQRVQTDVLAHLIVQFVKALQMRRVVRGVVHGAFKRATEMLGVEE